MKHEDSRRILIEFGNGKNWKVCKVIKIKENCTLGNHYHKKKDESFMLVEGYGLINREVMRLGKEYFVPNGKTHKFSLIKGSILICLCSEEFNPDDEISNSN